MLRLTEYQRLAQELHAEMSTEEVIAWAARRFSYERLVLTTGFGMEGCALIDLFARQVPWLVVAYLDTGFFFPETYALRDALVARYPHLTFVNRGTTLSPDAQAATYGPELWRLDPDQCCHLRKVAPMADALADAEAWVTAVTRSQSETRADTPLFSWDERFQLLKLAPLATWDRARVWQYVREHEVPYNPLHERGYPSIGCMQCTKPVASLAVGEYSRDGRWADREKTECGLHDAADHDEPRPT